MLRGKRLAALLSVAAIVASGSAVSGQLATPNGPRHEGSAVMADLPREIRIRNTVGTDGLGLCVWASTQMGANYLNVEELGGLFEDMKKEPGGGWPDRVDRVMKAKAPGREYRQYIGSDLDFIRQALDSGRPVMATYGYGEFYGMQTIAHMVLIVGMDDEFTAILDNNDPDHIWWMSTAEYRRRFNHPGGTGWAWYFLAPPPPPPPHN